MTAVHGGASAGRPRTSCAESRGDAKHQRNCAEKDEGEEKSRSVRTRLPLPLSSKQAWSDLSQDASPTVEQQATDEFQKVLGIHNKKRVSDLLSYFAL